MVNVAYVLEDNHYDSKKPLELDNKISEADRILEKAFEEREFIDEEGEKTIFIKGLKLNENSIDNLVTSVRRFHYFLSLDDKEEILIVPLAQCIDRTAILAMYALSEALNLRINFDDSNSSGKFYNRLVRDIEKRLVEKYIQPYYHQMRELQGRYHTAIKSTDEEILKDRFSKEDLKKDLAKLEIAFKKLFLHYEYIFSIEEDEIQSLRPPLEELIDSEYQPEVIVSIYENLLENNVEISDYVLLLIIEEAYWSMGKKEISITRLKEWLEKISQKKLPWNISELKRRYAERLEEMEDYEEAALKYGEIIEDIKEFGKDRRYATIQNKMIFCQIKKATEYSHETKWQRKLLECRNILLYQYADLEKFREVAISEILLLIKTEQYKKAIDLFDSTANMNYLYPLGDADFNQKCAFTILENLPNDFNNSDIRRYAKKKIEYSLNFYEEWGQMTRIISTLKCYINLEENLHKKSKLERKKEFWQKENEEINSKNALDINDDYIEYLFNENYFECIERIIPTLGMEISSDLNKKRIEAKRRINGEFGELHIDMGFMDRLYSNEDLENVIKHCERRMDIIKESLKNSYDFQDTIDLRYYRALLLLKRSKFRGERIPEEQIDISSRLVEIWKDLDSKYGELQWRRNLAMMKRHTDWSETIKELRRIAQFWEGKDSRRYFFLKQDLITVEKMKIKTTKYSSSWKDILKDPNVPDDFPTKKEIYTNMVRELMNEGDYSGALDAIRENKDITRKTEGFAEIRDSLRNDSKGVPYFSSRVTNNLIRNEIQCLIQMKKNNDAKKKIKKARKNGNISEIKSILFEIEMLEIQGEHREMQRKYISILEKIDNSGSNKVKGEVTSKMVANQIKDRTYWKLIELSKKTNDSSEQFHWMERKYVHLKINNMKSEKWLGQEAQRLTKHARELEYWEKSYLFQRWAIEHFESAEDVDYDLSVSWKIAGEKAVEVANNLSRKVNDLGNQQLGWMERAHECYSKIENKDSENYSKMKTNISAMLAILNTLIDEAERIEKRIKFRRKSIVNFERLNTLRSQTAKHSGRELTDSDRILILKELKERQELYFDILKVKKKYSKKVIELRICLWETYEVVNHQYNFKGDLDKKILGKSEKIMSQLKKSYSISLELTAKGDDKFIGTKERLAKMIESLSESIEDKGPNQLIEVLKNYMMIIKEMETNNYTHQTVIKLVRNNLELFLNRNRSLITREKYEEILLVGDINFNLSDIERWDKNIPMA